mmetsp:Transcript_3362/g.11831  ORF Transcript_3362/g.11831 Transcript_3362/m.11831 type:complete len:260 (+) Transcript_3362:25-804(+)
MRSLFGLLLVLVAMCCLTGGVILDIPEAAQSEGSVEAFDRMMDGVDLPYAFAFLPEAIWDAYNGVLAFTFTGAMGSIDVEGSQYYQPYDQDAAVLDAFLRISGEEGPPPPPYVPGGAGLESWMNITTPHFLGANPFYGVSYMGNYSYVQATLTSYTNESCLFVFTEQVHCSGWEEVAQSGTLLEYTNFCSIFRLESHPRISGSMAYRLNADAGTLMPTYMWSNTTVRSGVGANATVSSFIYEVDYKPLDQPMPYVECLR